MSLFPHLRWMYFLPITMANSLTKPPQPLSSTAIESLYLCYSTRLVWKSESFKWFKVLHISEKFKMWCRKRNKTPLHPEAENNPAAWHSAPLLHNSYSVSLPSGFATTPVNPLLWAVSFPQPFPTSAALAVVLKLLPIYTGLLCTEQQMLHDSCSACRHKLSIIAP